MELINNEELYKKIMPLSEKIKPLLMNSILKEQFEKDFAVRFCWSSNLLEGSTLSLDETLSVIEYDEVQSGHSYSEYHDAKRLYESIRKNLLPIQKREITGDWIKKCNVLIMESDGEYRKNPVFIGTLTEAVYYPTAPEQIRGEMDNFLISVNLPERCENIRKIAAQHVEFEQIHPFRDGNGRTGRMILNQQLINLGLLPVAIDKKSNYRQAFRRYQKNGDISMMEHIICKSELEALERMMELGQKIEPEREICTEQLKEKIREAEKIERGKTNHKRDFSMRI